MPAKSPPEEARVTVTAVAIEQPSLATRIEWYEEWEEKTREARELSRRDRDYYDNYQWTQEEIDTLEKRKQPVLTKNQIARKVNFVLGEEIAKRVDPVGRPRTPNDDDSARASTDALRYASDEEKFDGVKSAVTKNVLIEGYGGAIKEMDTDDEVENEDDESDDPKGKRRPDYKNVLNHVEWDRLFYDPASRKPDFSDAKYKGVVCWMDLDDAILEYPDAAEALQSAVINAKTSQSEDTDDVPRGWADGKRKRVKICEMYHRIGRDWYRSDFTEAADLREPERTFLLDEKQKHSVCPLVMVSCYIDRNGNRYGIVRQLISPQDEINKRSSKALHLLNVNRVISEEDAIKDPQKFQSEIAKPDGFATGIRPGAMLEGAVKIESGAEMAQGQFMLLQESKNDIATIGPSSSTLPDLPAGASGIAFQRRQKAASQELGTIFDQLSEWTHQVFCLDWLCIRQYWTDEKWLRVTDDQELTGYRFTALNQRMTRAQRFQELMQKQPPPPLESALAAAAGEHLPEIIARAQMQAQAIGQQMQAQSAQGQPPQPGQPPPQQPQPPDPQQLILGLILRDPLMQEPITLNQVDQMLVDIVIDESPDTAILADEQFETLGQLTPAIVQAKPDMAATMVKAMLRASTLPDKRALLQEFDKAPDPQQQQMQEQLQQLNMALAAANVEVAKTKAELQKAQAAEAAAKAQSIPMEAQANAVQSQAQAMVHAANAGEKTAAAPESQPGMGGRAMMGPNRPGMGQGMMGGRQ